MLLEVFKQCAGIIRPGFEKEQSSNNPGDELDMAKSGDIKNGADKSPRLGVDQRIELGEAGEGRWCRGHEMKAGSKEQSRTALLSTCPGAGDQD